jgi:DNA-binding transcriptional LysR family regulator
MNLQQLDHFLAVAETGSFSRAAEKVHLTQPALSRSIQALEAEIGAPLFARLGRRNELTDAGALVAARARRIKLEVSELKRSASRITNLEAGTLRLGLGPAPYEMLAAPLMAHVLKRHPQLGLHLSGGAPERQLQALRGREIDALVVHRRFVPTWDDLAVTLLPPMRLGFIARRKHPLAATARITAAKLGTYPLAATGIGPSGDILQKLEARFGATPRFDQRVQFRSDEISCLVESLKRSNVVFFGVVEVARRFITAGELVELPIAPALGLTSQFALVTLDGAAELPAWRVAREFIQATMVDQAPS